MAFLSLNGVEFFDADGEKIDLESVASSATVSSAYENKQSVDVLAKLIRGRPVHTALERFPTLSIKLKKPLHVSRIEIANRQGHWGHRAVHLEADIWCGSEKVFHYKNRDTERLLAQFDSIVGKLASPGTIEFDDPGKLHLVADSLFDKIVSELKEGLCTLSIPELTSLLPMHSEKPAVSDDMLIVFGELISRMLESRFVFPTKHLKDFEKILCTSDRMIKVVEYASISMARKTNVHRELVLAKHKIGIVNLVPQKKEYLKSVRVLEEQMLEWEIPVILCYGTLLGAVRDGQFIPHDDDVDLLYIDGSNSRKNMMENRERFMERLQESGYAIVDSGINFQAKPPGCKVFLDVFPSWSEADQTHLMVEQRKFRSVSTDVLLPVGEVELYGEMYPAPHDSPALLEHRYGDSWAESNPFYEWPWYLTQSDTVSDVDSKAA